MQWSDRIGRRLKLRDFHILLAVAKAGSMGKAVAELAISQPSISKAIADIEHAVGLRLLDRSPHGIQPTIYGSALLKCGVAVFDELRHGIKELDFLTDPHSGELRIGCTETMAAGCGFLRCPGCARLAHATRQWALRQCAGCRHLSRPKPAALRRRIASP
jgi:molybdenum-dependent DNA-binding transcriptional regulator ModE